VTTPKGLIKAPKIPKLRCLLEEREKNMPISDAKKWLFESFLLLSPGSKIRIYFAFWPAACPVAKLCCTRSNCFEKLLRHTSHWNGLSSCRAIFSLNSSNSVDQEALFARSFFVDKVLLALVFSIDGVLSAVFRIRIRIPIRIHMFLGHKDPDPSIIKQK
jgi:hypothetical protein